MSPTAELPVLLLLLAPLSAAILSLLGKIFSSRIVILPAFLLWVLASLWALAASAPAVFSGTALEYTLGGWMEPYGIGLRVNGLTWIATLTDILIASAAWLCTRRYRRFDPLFYFFFFLALFSLQGLLCTKDIFNLFIWFEVLSLSSFVLIAYDGSVKSRIAALNYLLISSMSILFFLIGVWILYQLSGVLALDEMAARFSALQADSAGNTLFGTQKLPVSAGVALALISVGILTRAAVFPFHMWLPQAHAAADYPVSALLSGFVIKAPMLTLWRIFDYLSFPGLMDLLIWLGAIGALWGVFAAMVQKDAKILLGYHSVSQMGYIVAAFGFGGHIGRSAALFYIIAHALFKSLLFLTVGHVTSRSGSRDVYKLRGLFRFFPSHALLYMVAAAAISGLPLLAGYTGKLLISDALHSHPAYYLLLAAGVGTAASFTKLSLIFFGKGNPDQSLGLETVPSDLIPSSLASTTAHIGMLLIAGGCLIMGIFPQTVHRLILVLTEPGLADLKQVVSATELSHWYEYTQLAKAFLSIGAGILLSLFLLSPPGKAFSHLIRSKRLGLNAALRLISIGFVAAILVGFWAY